MTFSDTLKKVRAELNITQEQFARELNISFSTLSRWENGHTVPSRLAKMRLLEFCNEHPLSHDITASIKEL